MDKKTEIIKLRQIHTNEKKRRKDSNTTEENVKLMDFIEAKQKVRLEKRACVRVCESVFVKQRQLPVKSTQICNKIQFRNEK